MGGLSSLAFLLPCELFWLSWSRRTTHAHWCLFGLFAVQLPLCVLCHCWSSFFLRGDGGQEDSVLWQGCAGIAIVLVSGNAPFRSWKNCDWFWPPTIQWKTVPSLYPSRNGSFQTDLMEVPILSLHQTSKCDFLRPMWEALGQRHRRSTSRKPRVRRTARIGPMPNGKKRLHGQITIGTGRKPSRSPRFASRSQTPQGKKKQRRGKKNKQKKDYPKHKAPPLPESPGMGQEVEKEVLLLLGESQWRPNPRASPIRSFGKFWRRSRRTRRTWPQSCSNLCRNRRKCNHKMSHVSCTPRSASWDKPKRSCKRKPRASQQNLHHVWRSYMADSVNKWKGLCEQCEQQDSELAKQLIEKLQTVKLAEAGLESCKKEAKKTRRSRRFRAQACRRSQNNWMSMELWSQDGMSNMLKNLDPRSASRSQRRECLKKTPLGNSCRRTWRAWHILLVSSSWTAFCEGRSIDQREINPWPHCVDPQSLILKWSHGAVRKSSLCQNGEPRLLLWTWPTMWGTLVSVMLFPNHAALVRIAKHPVLHFALNLMKM